MFRVIVALFLCVGVLALVGCGGATTSNPQAGGKPNEEEAEKKAKIAANLAKLPEADRKLAEKQKDCPVAGEPLGSMGVPMKVDVKGTSVFICCEACKEDLLKNADKFLAELKKE